MHYGPFKFVPLLFTPSRIFNDQNVLHDSLNLFRYIWHHLVQSEQNCLWWLFFKSVPLLFTISSIFGDKIVHDVSSKTVPLLFTPSNIFWKKSYDGFSNLPLYTFSKSIQGKIMQTMSFKYFKSLLYSFEYFVKCESWTIKIKKIQMIANWFWKRQPTSLLPKQSN